MGTYWPAELPAGARRGIINEVIEVAKNEHLFIQVKSEDRPDLSIDIEDRHGRRGMSVRVGGMSVASLLVDVKELETTKDRALMRFCPYCGEEINLISSKTHHCSVDPAQAIVVAEYHGSDPHLAGQRQWFPHFLSAYMRDPSKFGSITDWYLVDDLAEKRERERE